MAILGKPAAGTYTFDPAAWGANSTPAPDSYYNVDEGTGTVLTNIGKDAGSHNGTITGATWGTESGSAILTFDGVDDFVEFTVFGITTFPCTIAVVCRCLADAASVVGIFNIANGAVANVYHGINAGSSEKLQFHTRNTTAFLSNATTGNLFDGSYHLLVLTLISDTSKKGYHGATITAPEVTNSVLIGSMTRAKLACFADSTASNFANIAVASVMVWKGVALSVAQVQTDLAGNPFGFLAAAVADYSIVADLPIGMSLASTMEYEPVVEEEVSEDTEDVLAGGWLMLMHLLDERYKRK